MLAIPGTYPRSHGVHMAAGLSAMPHPAASEPRCPSLRAAGFQGRLWLLLPDYGLGEQADAVHSGLAPWHRAPGLPPASPQALCDRGHPQLQTQVRQALAPCQFYR